MPDVEVNRHVELLRVGRRALDHWNHKPDDDQHARQGRVLQDA
jgi:hypothetical protein